MLCRLIVAVRCSVAVCSMMLAGTIRTGSGPDEGILSLRSRLQSDLQLDRSADAVGSGMIAK